MVCIGVERFVGNENGIEIHNFDNITSFIQSICNNGFDVINNLLNFDDNNFVFKIITFNEYFFNCVNNNGTNKDTIIAKNDMVHMRNSIINITQNINNAVVTVPMLYSSSKKIHKHEVAQIASKMIVHNSYFTDTGWMARIFNKLKPFMQDNALIQTICNWAELDIDELYNNISGSVLINKYKEDTFIIDGGAFQQQNGNNILQDMVQINFAPNPDVNNMVNPGGNDMVNIDVIKNKLFAIYHGNYIYSYRKTSYIDECNGDISNGSLYKQGDGTIKLKNVNNNVINMRNLIANNIFHAICRDIMLDTRRAQDYHNNKSIQTVSSNTINLFKSEHDPGNTKRYLKKYTNIFQSDINYSRYNRQKFTTISIDNGEFLGANNGIWLNDMLTKSCIVNGGKKVYNNRCHEIYIRLMNVDWVCRLIVSIL